MLPAKKRSAMSAESSPSSSDSEKRTSSPSLPPRRQRRLGTPDAVAAPVDLPVSRLTRPEQKKGMSCSLATMQSIGKAFGKPTYSEDKMLERTQSRKGGTYNVKAGGKGIPPTTVAHTEGMGAYGATRDKSNFKKIVERGHAPIIVTSTGGGKHVMAARPGTPLGKPGKMELMDTMRRPAQSPVFRDYDDVLSGRRFNIGRLPQEAHSLYGIAPTRGGRSASTSSVVSTDDALTRGAPARPSAPLRQRPGKRH